MHECEVPGCNRKPIARLMCRPHYGRQHRTGMVRPEVPVGSHQPFIRIAGKLSVQDAARILGVSTTTVRRYGDTGRLGVHLDARGWRWFDPAEVRALFGVDEAVPREPQAKPEPAPRPERRPVRRTLDLIDTDEL